MTEFLLIRLEGPLQSWGDVSMDQVHPTNPCPTRSALAGLLASALGWSYADGARTNALQHSIQFAVREDRRPNRLRDFQTADLSRDSGGWTRWGYEGRGGSQKAGTHLMTKHYLADGSFLVALTVEDGPVDLTEIIEALRHPARPLFLGRKSCPPSTALAQGTVSAETLLDALTKTPVGREYDQPPLRYWGPLGAKDDDGAAREVWHRRDYVSDVFVGSDVIIESVITPVAEAEL